MPSPITALRSIPKLAHDNDNTRIDRVIWYCAGGCARVARMIRMYMNGVDTLDISRQMRLTEKCIRLTLVDVVNRWAMR